MKKVVVLGGGTGLSVLLRGLKLFPLDITAIVSVADDGSSTGKLRQEFNIPAVGDLRNVLVSLSEVEPLVEQLLQYRFHTSSDLNNHAMGNLLLTALYNITGSLTKSLESLSKILNIKGKILPFTEDKAILVAHTKDNETIIGESKITKAGKKIEYIEYEHEVKVTDQALEAVKKADLIVFSMGSLYTSILPNVINKEMKEALIKSNAKKVYICNIMTEHGETDNFNVSNFIKVINQYTKENFLDAIIANTTPIDLDVKQIYEKEEQSTPILIDDENLDKMKIEVIKENLAVINNKQVRHDYMKTAFAIFSYIMRGRIWVFPMK